MTTELKQAIYSDNVALIRSLIVDGNPNDPIAGDPPLYIAAALGRIPAAQALIDLGADINLPTPHGNTPLIIACRRGHLDMVEFLLGKGANVNAVTSIAKCALTDVLIAADSPAHLRIVDALIQAGANFETTPTGRPVLPYAMSNAKIPGVAKALLDRGANPNGIHQDSEAAPLHLAISYANLAAVTELLEAGADPLLRAPEGDCDWSLLTPLEYAKKVKFKKAVALLESRAGGGPAAGSAKASPPVDPWDVLAQRVAAAPQGKLLPGASSKEIAACEAAVGLALPSVVADFFGAHNGQKGKAPALLAAAANSPGYRLLSLKEAAREWTTMQQLVEGGDFADQKPVPDKGVKSKWWNPKWLPFGANGGGDLLCFDLDPAKGGKQGQVVEFLHEAPRRALLAASPQEFLASQATE